LLKYLNKNLKTLKFSNFQLQLRMNSILKAYLIFIFIMMKQLKFKEKEWN